MKVATIGMPRTRSSYLLDLVSNKFNLENNFESYQDLLQGSWRSRLWIKDSSYWDSYIRKASVLTNKLFAEDNFSIKIFSNVLISPDLKNHVTNFEFLRLHDYDLLFFLHRNNIIDLVVSQLTARRIKKFLYTHDNVININSYKDPLNLSDNKIIREIDYILVTYKYHFFFRGYIEKSNLKIIDLEYSDIPDYAKRNFSDVESVYKNNDIEYSKILENYDEVSHYITNRYQYIDKNFSFGKLEDE